MERTDRVRVLFNFVFPAVGCLLLIMGVVALLQARKEPDAARAKGTRALGTFMIFVSPFLAGMPYARWKGWFPGPWRYVSYIPDVIIVLFAIRLIRSAPPKKR